MCPFVSHATSDADLSSSSIMMHACCRWLEGDILGTPSTLLSTTTAKNRLRNVRGRLTQDPMPVQSFRYSSGICAMSSDAAGCH